MTLLQVHVLGLLNFTHFVSTAGYGAIFILCVLQSCCVPTSSELTLGFAGVLAAQGKLSLIGVIAVGALGEVVGAYIAWAVGRYAGRVAVDRFGRYILLSHRDLDKAEAWYARHERFGVFGSRLLPVIRNFVALPAGIAEVPLGRFGLLTAAGSLLWDGAWAGIGYGIAGQWHTIASGFGDIGYVLAVLVVGVVVFGAYHRYRSYAAAMAEEHGGAPPGRGLQDGGRPGPGAHPQNGRPPGPRGTRSGQPAHAPGPSAAEAGPTRWLASSTGRPPLSRPVAAVAAPGTDRWVGSSSGRPVSTSRRNDFPNSPIAAWEAAVSRGRQDVAAPIERTLVDVDDAGVESNGRLTAMLGLLLLLLLAIEGATLLRITSLLTVHVVIGMVLVPVICLKIGSTTWRFAKYYLGSPAYRRKGPPPQALRLLGPFVVVLSVAVMASGIALLLAPPSLRNELLFIHKASFVLWFIAMAVHVLGHLLDVAQLAPRDFLRRTRRQVRGASLRQWAIVSSVVVGILLGVAVAPKVGPWLAGLEQQLHKPGAHGTVTVHPGATGSSTSGPAGTGAGAGSSTTHP